jgi:hypothetical protein
MLIKNLSLPSRKAEQLVLEPIESLLDESGDRPTALQRSAKSNPKLKRSVEHTRQSLVTLILVLVILMTGVEARTPDPQIKSTSGTPAAYGSSSLLASVRVAATSESLYYYFLPSRATRTSCLSALSELCLPLPQAVLIDD